MSRTAEAQAVDSAWSTFRSAYRAWLSAGGSRKLLWAWIGSQVLNELSQQVRSVSPADFKGLRGKTLEDADPGA